MIGKVIKAISGFYYVEFKNNIYECHAKGILKKNNMSPLVGDFVEFEILGEKTGNLITVVNRKNLLIRPPVANIDEVFIVMAVKNPEPSLLFLDKQLVFLEWANIPATICINKTDIGDVEKIKNIYEKIGYKVLLISAKEDIGIQQLKEEIREKTVAFIGNSGVGKSSITNQLMDKMIMKEGNLSKIDRGKQTTRHSEILKIEDGTYIMDTPGFSSFELTDISSSELAYYFVEFKPFFKDCCYKDCRHAIEEECGINKAVSNGMISMERFENFKFIYNELKRDSVK